MRKHYDNALLVFARTPKILGRAVSDDPLAALPWEDIDMLFTAMVGDVIRNASQLEHTDILVYRNSAEYSDDYFLPFRSRLQLIDLPDGLLTEHIQAAVDSAFRQGYHRVIALLDNNPLITTATLSGAFDHLRFEDDCLVVGPTPEGKYSLLGMKMNHSELFDSTESDPVAIPDRLLERCCALDSMIFPTPSPYFLDTTVNLARLKRDIEALDRSVPDFPSKTSEVMRIFERKYKARRSVR
jgi:glycosyltransferase A (GT-A) superfamily protein (DUF2064 family)